MMKNIGPTNVIALVGGFVTIGLIALRVTKSISTDELVLIMSAVGTMIGVLTAAFAKDSTNM